MIHPVVSQHNLGSLASLQQALNICSIPFRHKFCYFNSSLKPASSQEGLLPPSLPNCSTPQLLQCSQDRSHHSSPYCPAAHLEILSPSLRLPTPDFSSSHVGRTNLNFHSKMFMRGQREIMFSVDSLSPLEPVYSLDSVQPMEKE